MQKYDFNIIGTHLQVLIDTDMDCSEVFHSIESRLSDFEQKFSRFLEDNWLADLNTSRRALLDADAKNMLMFALDMARKTDGYFDPTVGKKLTELGYGVIMNYESVILNTESHGDYRDIEIRGDEVILHGDILLEFGGVGKGYLIDVIRSIIINDKLGIMNCRFLINFGGDMYGRGGWTVGLESPFASDEVIGTFSLVDDYLACSAGTKRKWADHHHLIDPKTGESAREVVATYITGSSGISTDSYATALSVMPGNKSIEMLQKTPEISGVIVKYDGILFQKEGSEIEVFG